MRPDEDNEPRPLEDDQPMPRSSLGARVNSGIRPEEPGSRMNWYRAQTRGWTRAQFDHWVETGEEP